jgi:ligand-binding sensor domain-containing protein/signal transduction histidine kinase
MPNKLIRLLFISFTFCIGHYSIGQTLIPRFESLGVNDGLPHSSVYSITQDKKGFMWFGTPDGLCRYDGSLLVSFKYIPQTQEDVVNNFVRGKLMEDKAGNIWYSNESGIYKWDVATEKIMKVRPFKKSEFGNSAFQAIMLDENGSMWMMNILYGIFEFDINSGKLRHYPVPYPINYTAMLLAYYTTDDAGNIWVRILSENDSWFVFNKTSHQYSARLKENPPHAIFFSKETEVQAFEDRLVYRDLRSNQSHTVPKIINNKKIRFYSFDGARDNYGRLWMTARGNGLFYYDERNDRFGEFRHDNSKLKSLPFDLTTCLFIDRNQNLWVGIDGGGVARLDLKQPKFNLFPLSEGDYPVLNDYFTKCFYEDTAGRIWFGSHTNGLNILDTKTNALINYHFEKKDPQSLPGNSVGSILKDRDGNMWIGSSGGISLFDEKKGLFKTIVLRGLPVLHPEMNIFVYRMIQLNNGDLIAATLLGLIKIGRKENGSYEGNYLTDRPFLNATSTDIAEMPDGSIYTTMPGTGMFELKRDATGYDTSATYLNGIDLRSLRVDEKLPGYLWVATGKGLVHFNTSSKKFKLWNEKDGLANSYIYGVLQENNGDLWISTNGGLSYFNRTTEKFENYSYEDGLQSNEFNTQAFYKSPTGVFYFGGIKGFNWFKPGYVSKDPIKPVAAITRIEINDSIFQKDSGYFLNHTITVAYDKNDFSFQFAALDYTRPEANNIQYMLQGWDAGWVSADNSSARYINLPPGGYLLRVKGSNAEGIWSDEEQVKIIIRSPFWKRTPFVVAFALLLLAAIIFITYRISQAKAKRKLGLLEKQIAVDAERNRISADMHDEIGSGITHIALLSELIQTQEKTPGELKKDINTIGTSARKLVQTMSEIIWALNPHNDTLENLLAYTREQSKKYFESMDVQFDIHFPDVVPKVKLSNAQRRNLYLVTREALNNAMKHSGAAIIGLKFEITNKAFCFSVSDDGKGINEKSNKSGRNGIRNMNKRMEDIGGTIEWLSTEKGTSVNYCFIV